MGRLDGLEAFVRVVEEGSFTAAAQKLGVSKSHVSKQVARLEDRLGARLLQRTTRRIAPTDEGRAFFERGRTILTELDEAERAIGRLHDHPIGTLRLTVPMSFGQRYLGAAIADFLALHPQLGIDLELNDRVVDIIAEGFDIAVRVGSLPDSSMFARKLGPTRMFVCASPTYLEEHGTPTHPSELRHHRCLVYSYARSRSWHFEHPDETAVHVRNEGPLVANNGDVMLQAAINGLGIVVLPDFIAVEDLRAGRLRAILPEWELGRGAAIWAVYPHNRHLSTKVRAFVDFLVERFRSPPWCHDCQG